MACACLLFPIPVQILVFAYLHVSCFGDTQPGNLERDAICGFQKHPTWDEGADLLLWEGFGVGIGIGVSPHADSLMEMEMEINARCLSA